MTHVKIKVRPRQTVRFPAICVHCGRPAPAAMVVQKRISRITRRIAVPVCAGCAAQLGRRSYEEERLRKIGWLSGSGLFLLVLVLGLALVPAGWPLGLRLLLVGLLAAGATAVLAALFRRQIRQAYLPEKKAVLEAARIQDFSWRATTFAFANETFSQRFREINEPLLMEI